MSTAVWVVACTVPANVNGSTLSDQCPISDRILIQSTVEVLSGIQTQQEFDYAYFSSAFFVAFTFTVGLWLFAKNLGIILSFIRRG
ncbi:hypothetical protein D9M69_687760 [compost metagenome]